nr:YqiA/YcfP family alpha/beta fold hydrolase [Thioalkalivibrio sp. XN279]
MRRLLARGLVRTLVRRDLAPSRSLAARRRAVDRAARLLRLPRGVRSMPAAGFPGSEWLLPAGVATADSGPAILYLHGGGFVLGSPRSHRSVAAHLAAACARPVLLLDYPLAPEQAFPAAPDTVLEAWERVTAAGGRPIALAGDSAGGWLALRLALQAGAMGLPAPTAMALFSPLLDLGRASASTAPDLMLPPGFVAAGIRAFAGGLPPADPRLDLLGQSLAGLPPLFIAYDADEMLAPDSRRLAEAAAAAGVRVRVAAESGLWHAWPLLAGLLPEAGATLRQAAAVLAPRRGAVS